MNDGHPLQWLPRQETEQACCVVCSDEQRTRGVCLTFPREQDQSQTQGSCCHSCYRGASVNSVMAGNGRLGNWRKLRELWKEDMLFRVFGGSSLIQFSSYLLSLCVSFLLERNRVMGSMPSEKEYRHRGQWQLAVNREMRLTYEGEGHQGVLARAQGGCWKPDPFV